MVLTEWPRIPAFKKIRFGTSCHKCFMVREQGLDDRPEVDLKAPLDHSQSSGHRFAFLFFSYTSVSGYSDFWIGQYFMEERPLNLNMSGPSLVTEPEPNNWCFVYVVWRSLMRGHCEALYVVWLGSAGCVV